MRLAFALPLALFLAPAQQSPQSVPASQPRRWADLVEPYEKAAALEAPPTGALRVFLARHGQSVGNATRDDPKLSEEQKDKLSEKGKAEATALGTTLVKLGVTALLCSPAKRAEESAALVAEAFAQSAGVRPQTDASFGPLAYGRASKAGQSPLSELASAWREGKDVRLEGGESLADMASRLRRGFADLARTRATAPGATAVVAHGEVVLAAVLAFDASQLPKLLTTFSLPNASFAALDVASDGAVTLRGIFAPPAPPK
ncbi:MAG: histidine phosphatase family protein [Planctomycetes bacterium]|nr:histidine phosphatase family protein [Planctomycetota bacterium]